MDIFEEIKQSFRAEQESLKDFLAKGQVEDYNHYSQVVGAISGIAWSYNRLTEIFNKRMEIDEDDD